MVTGIASASAAKASGHCSTAPPACAVKPAPTPMPRKTKQTFITGPEMPVRIPASPASVTATAGPTSSAAGTDSTQAATAPSTPTARVRRLNQTSEESGARMGDP